MLCSSSIYLRQCPAVTVNQDTKVENQMFIPSDLTYFFIHEDLKVRRVLGPLIEKKLGDNTMKKKS